MSISFCTNERFFRICIGKNTPWFKQIFLISFIEEFYNNDKLYYADLLWHT